MLPKIAYVKALDEYNLYIRFNDGKQFVYDASSILWGELGEPLKDTTKFDTVHTDPEIGLLEWDNGLTIDTIVLYDLMQKEEHKLISSALFK